MDMDSLLVRLLEAERDPTVDEMDAERAHSRPKQRAAVRRHGCREFGGIGIPPTSNEWCACCCGTGGRR